MQRFLALAIALAALPLTGCAGSPIGGDKTPSMALADTGDTYLARRVTALGDPRDGSSGIHLVRDGAEALALRLFLIEKAERSIDAQYYIFDDDTSGDLIAGQLLMAAGRGVRVRLLLDDMYTAGHDQSLAALDAHPNIEIRLFNPFRRDVGRGLGGLLDFRRVDRRMHNKAMTFDDALTVVGGRNLADVYFSASDDSNYDDLDALAAGPAARETSRVFDAYWNSPYAVPVAALAKDESDPMTLDTAEARVAERYEVARSGAFGAALGHRIRRELASAKIALDWAPTRVVADPPEKAGGETDGILAREIGPVVTSARSELAVAAGYFVPGERGVAMLGGIARGGARVVVLTNSLDSNDVTPVYAHYARYREALLRAGVELWELRPDRERQDRDILSLGQSRSGLHGKTFVVDRRRLFVGSFNWDPRSVWINTEMGLVVDSPRLAGQVARRFEADLPSVAYRLRLAPAGGVEWLERREDGIWIAWPEEPSASRARRLAARILGALPIESEL